MKKPDFHEDFGQREEISHSSERSFGLTFAAVFLLLGGYLYWKHHPYALWVLGGVPVFLLLGLVWAAPLKPFNFLWFKLSMLLYRVVNPVVLGLLFFLTILPIGLLLRLFGKDLLRLKQDAQADTYWIPRDPPGPAPETMKNQF